MLLAEPITLTLDIDGVLVNNFDVWKPYFESQAKAHNHDPEMIPFGDSPCWDYWGDICKKCWNDVLHNKDMVENYELLPDAVPVLELMQTIGFKMHLLTSRPKDVTDSTYKWAEEKLGKLIESVQISDDKVGVSTALGARFHVDDAPKHIEKFLMQSHVQHIIWDHPYNTMLDGPRVQSWPQYGAFVLWAINL